jgi:hypothetical protein
MQTDPQMSIGIARSEHALRLQVVSAFLKQNRQIVAV